MRLGQSRLGFGVDLRALDQAFLDDPYPYYHALRTHDPVHRCPDGSYFLTRYRDIASIYRDPARFSSDKRREFKLASALPIQLIGDMLGIPGDERGPLRDWSLAILGALEPRLTTAQFERGCRAVGVFKDYLRRHIAARRQDAQDEGEILSQLIAAEADGETLSELELLHNCIFLLNAGHETTTNLIGNGIEALLRFPAEHERLRIDAGLIKPAVEEFLRFESSNQLGNRRVTEACDIGGIQLAAGTYLHLCIGAANRDPAEFPDPDRLDLTRMPNRHLAFAAGIHVCAGASLARMEAQVAIGRVVQRFPKLRLAGEPIRGGRARFRGFSKLPVTW